MGLFALLFMLAPPLVLAGLFVVRRRHTEVPKELAGVEAFSAVGLVALAWLARTGGLIPVIMLATAVVLGCLAARDLLSLR